MTPALSLPPCRAAALSRLGSDVAEAVSARLDATLRPLAALIAGMQAQGHSQVRNLCQSCCMGRVPLALWMAANVLPFCNKLSIICAPVHMPYVLSSGL